MVQINFTIKGQIFLYFYIFRVLFSKNLNNISKNRLIFFEIDGFCHKSLDLLRFTWFCQKSLNFFSTIAWVFSKKGWFFSKITWDLSKPVDFSQKSLDFSQKSLDFLKILFYLFIVFILKNLIYFSNNMVLSIIFRVYFSITCAVHAFSKRIFHIFLFFLPALFMMQKRSILWCTHDAQME